MHAIYVFRREVFNNNDLQILIFDFSEAVKKSSFKNSSEDEIITSIGKWLTCAKGRLLEKEKKENNFCTSIIIIKI